MAKQLANDFAQKRVGDLLDPPERKAVLVPELAPAPGPAAAPPEVPKVHEPVTTAGRKSGGVGNAVPGTRAAEMYVLGVSISFPRFHARRHRTRLG